MVYFSNCQCAFINSQRFTMLLFILYTFFRFCRIIKHYSDKCLETPGNYIAISTLNMCNIIYNHYTFCTITHHFFIVIMCQPIILKGVFYGTEKGDLHC